ncbi:hypothetical protein G8764_20135 [Pseudomaricurvus alcaniphilus]|uniref:hypothetical protein n=1 Tax=Pseudomaricurvus alcaniphilus TaxID=1166482 RepID=UPI0014092EC7|nr:hypothetical protein [Pseudomaricurvus alcaniphilus]NHN39616.1 hypothetical protein [Pseudomaricurvus alcaniphilus]
MEVAGLIAGLRGTFCLTDEELAQICRVDSFADIESWVDGKRVPSKEESDRLSKLHSIRGAWNHYALVDYSDEIRRKILDGKSILDLLTEPELNERGIIFAGTKLFITSPRHAGEIIHPYGSSS